MNKIRFTSLIKHLHHRLYWRLRFHERLSAGFWACIPEHIAYLVNRFRLAKTHRAKVLHQLHHAVAEIEIHIIIHQLPEFTEHVSDQAERLNNYLWN